MAGGEPLLGRTLAGRFRITGFIGEGAMASVFRGVDVTQEGPAADVAVKVMHPHLSGDPTFTGRFRLEAKAAARLSHPNSVRIVDCGEDGRLFFIVMELVQGRDLAEILTLERRLSPARACRLLALVCDALGTAHAQSIVHRDLKPENVMVVEDPAAPGGETVKVLDFGIAKLLDAPVRGSGEGDGGPSSALTRVGTVVGTPAYMSPEQCRGQPVDGRSDLYTCGVLLYQLVTGKVPFWSDSPFEIAARQVREAPAPPSQHVDGLDPELEALILRALAKKPAERFASAEELRDALRAIEPRLADQRLSPRVGGKSAAPPRPAAAPEAPPRPPEPPAPPAPRPLTPAPPIAPAPSMTGGGAEPPLGAPRGSAPAGSLEARPRGGTIPMGAGLEHIVRQVHEEAERQRLSGSAPFPHDSLPPGPLAGPVARPRDERASRGGPSAGLLAALVLASVAFGVGAGFLAWALSR